MKNLQLIRVILCYITFPPELNYSHCLKWALLFGHRNVLSMLMNECVAGVLCTCSGWLALESGVTIQIILRLLRAALVVKEQGSTAAWPRATWILLWETVTSNACTYTIRERRASSAYINTEKKLSVVVWNETCLKNQKSIYSYY